MKIFDYPHKVDVQGNSFTYYREGKGETVIFIHGITTYSFIWRKIVPYFEDKFDVILVDLLGCGDSDKPLNEDFSLKRQAHLINDFCGKLKIDKFHLVCHDVGGGIGQIFAVNYPSMLYSLVLINSVAYNFWPVQPIIALRTPVLRQMAMATLDFGIFELIVKRGLFHKSRLNSELMGYFWKPMKTSAGRKAFLHFARCLDNKDLIEIENDLRNMIIPVLIIRGDADVYLSAEIARKLNSEIPNSSLFNIETGGHFIQEDEPEIVADSIIHFITGNGIKS